MKIFEFNNYIIEYPEEIPHEIFDAGYCYGIKFFNENSYYELIYNREVNWSRILWSSINFHSKDMPFNESTCKLLPNGITVRKRNE